MSGLLCEFSVLVAYAVSIESAVELTGIMASLNLLFKQGKREDMLPLAPYALAKLKVIFDPNNPATHKWVFINTHLSATKTGQLEIPAWCQVPGGHPHSTTSQPSHTAGCEWGYWRSSVIMITII